MGKRASVGILILAEIAVMALWFSSAAVVAEMGAEAGIAPAQLGWLTTAVQLGFAGGAVAFALLGIADRFDPRRVFCLSALIGAASTLALLSVPVGGWAAIGLRALTGAALAGVYPVGMKIATGWGTRDRGLLVGLLVGALTLGSSSPHLLALLGGAEWRATLVAASVLAALGGVAALSVGLGPHHAKAPRLDLAAVGTAWTDRRLRYAILGYLGHMWELYALWAWVGLIAATSYGLAGMAEAEDAAKLTAFLTIALGGLVCVPAGMLADRVGRARVAAGCLVLSGLAGLATAAAFGGPVWLVALCLVVWGLAVIPDSALYSAMVADAAPPEWAGSLMTLQTALGFLLTVLTVQGVPLLAGLAGWPLALAALALGPLGGSLALRAYLRLTPPST